MADYNLGTARGSIELNYRDNGSPGRARRDLDGVGRSAGLAGGILSKAAVGFGAAGVGLAAGIGLAVSKAADFQQKLSTVQAVSGATGAQMEQLRGKALQLGKDTQYSAGEAADAIGELAKAGVSLPDILNGAADATVSLAAAGGVDLPQAATIASNAMNQFQLAAKDLPKVADLLAGAANASAVDVTDLGNSLAYVGPVAHALGVSLGDTSTALAILGNQGIKGSSAGTALRSIFAQLTPSTKKAKDAFKELNLITADGTNQFYDATGKLKPLNQVIDLLHNSTQNLSKAQLVAFSKKAFGTEDLAAISILAGQTGASVDKMTASIGKVSAADVAKTRMNNLKGSVEQLKGSAETLAIMVGTTLLPALKGAADGANAFLGKAIDLTDKIPALIAYVQALAGKSLTTLQAALANPAVQRFITSVERLGAVLRGPALAGLRGLVAAAGPLAKIIAGALYVAFIGLSYAMEGAASTAEFISRNIKTIGIVAAALLVILAPLFIAITVGFIGIGAAATTSAAAQVGAWIASQVAAARSGVTTLLWSYRIVGGWIAQGASAVASAARTVASWVVTGAAAVAGGVRAIIAGAIVVGQWVLMGLSALAGAAQVALAWLIALGPVGLLIAAVILVGVIIATHFKQFVAIITGAWNAIKSATSTAFNAVKAAIGVALAFVGGLIRSYINLYKVAFTAGFNAVRTVVSTVFNAISGVVRSILGAISGFISTEVRGITNIFHGIENIVGIITGAFGRAKTAVETAIGNIISYVAAIPGKITGALGDLGSMLFSVGINIIQGMINGMGSMVGAAVQKVKDVAASVVSGAKGLFGIKSPSTVFHTIGENVIQGMINGINAKKAAAVKAAQLVARSMTEAVRTDKKGNRFNAAGQQLTQSFIDGVRDHEADMVAAARAAADKAMRAVAAAKVKASALKTLEGQGVAIFNAIVSGVKTGKVATGAVESRIQTFIAQLSKAAQAGVKNSTVTNTVTNDNNRLNKLSAQRLVVAKKLAAANAQLVAVQKQYSDMKTSVSSSVSGLFDVTQGNGTISGTLASAQNALTKAKQFQANIKALIAKGFSKTEVAKLAAAGPDASATQVNGLLGATSAQVKQFNTLTSQLATTADSVGTTVAGSLYNAGINAAKGLVKGLSSQQKAIDAQMNRIALAMAKVIKSALGIHSPSKLFQGFGVNTLQGLVNGLEKQFPSLMSTMNDAAKLMVIPTTIGATVGRTATGGSAFNAPVATGNTKQYNVTVNRAKDVPTQKIITEELRRMESLYGNTGGY